MRKLLLAVALVLAGCRNDEFTLERIDPGAECPNGGVRLTVPGKAPQVVCDGADGTNGTNGSNGTNGADGANGDAGVDGQVSLVRQVAISAGDVRCPTGGVEVQSGIDTSGDGTLDASEVTSRTVVCNGNTGALLGSTTPPAGDAGTATIKANGGFGLATGNNGGTGGQVQLNLFAGSNGGHLKAWTTGRVDATQAVPTVPAVDPGSLLVNITSDTTITVPQDLSAVDAGTIVALGGGLYQAAGGPSAPRPVTGLAVASGATLTLPVGTFTFAAGCRIDGALTFAVGQAPAAAALTCADLAFGASSQLRAPGASVVVLRASVGDFVARGAMNLSGDATVPPSYLELGAAQSLYAVGAIRTNGSAAGLNAANIRFSAGNDIVLAGAIEARGADLVWATGSAFAGNGGQVTVDQYYPFTFGHVGEFRTTANVSVRGGSVTGDLVTCGTSCVGGAGGNFGGSIAVGFIDGSIDARGGSAFNGGPGGVVNFIVSSGAQPAFPMSSLYCSANIDASGGDGSTGGSGGSVSLQLGNPSAGGELVLLGYAGIEANGRFGNLGGNGGSITMAQNSNNGEVTGAVINTVPLSVVGGDASDSLGGRGGNITLQTNAWLVHPGVNWETVTNSGALSLAGGRGTSGGAGGVLRMFGLSGLTSTGAITASGGAGTTSGGGGGGFVQLGATRGELINSTGITVAGGVSGGGLAQTPGTGGFIDLVAEHINNAGGLVARGGSADPTTGRGGDGGRVRLASQLSPTTMTAPKPAGIDVRGGAAATPGLGGLVMIDGFLDTSSWTH